jgi:Ca2+-binding EF-hand superfamily protein
LNKKASNDQHLLAVMQKAFDKGHTSHMDTEKMIDWIKQELQTGYRLEDNKAL